jgi:TonB-dependent receptor
MKSKKSLPSWSLLFCMVSFATQFATAQEEPVAGEAKTNATQVEATVAPSASQGLVRGRVVDKNNQPMSGVKVTLQSGKEAVTDIQGSFLITGLNAGEQTITVSGIGISSVTKTVAVSANQTSVINIQVEAGVTSLPNMVVTDNLGGQAKALNTQMNKGNITNIVSADQVGRFPDANVGDALKRLPGVNVQYDQGEARFGNIRGTAPQYNSVTINGERIPSAEAEDRTVQLDLVPSDMLQAIEVNKAVTPDMDADAIGGSVNLVTRSAPYDRRVSLTLGSGYNLLAEEPMLTGAAVVADRFFDKSLGVVASASYNNHKLGSDNFENAWVYSDEDDKDGSAYVEEQQIRQYYLQRIRQSYGLAMDYIINDNHTLFASGIYNWREDYESRFRTVYKDIEEGDDGVWTAEISKETKGGDADIKNRRLEDQRMFSYSLGGEHQFGKVSLDWSGAFSKASEERPNERYIGYRKKDVEVNPNITSLTKPRILVANSGDDDLRDDFSLKEITEEFQYTREIDKNFRLDALLPMMENQFANELKMGVRYRGKDKRRDNKFYEYKPLDEDEFTATTFDNLGDYSKDNFLAGDYRTGLQVKEEYLANLKLTNTNEFDGERIIEEQLGNFDALENIFAGYMMINQQLGPNLSAIAGVRVENTQQEYQGREYDADDDVIRTTDWEKSSYTDILPGLHVKYNFNPTTVVRAAWTNTLARPHYYSLVPYREVVREDNEIELGNPELTPTKAMNFDLMMEKYFESIGVISAGMFYKSIKDFIVEESRSDYSFEGNTWDKYTQPINGGNGSILGFEVAAQRQLDFLPGFLSGFGVYLNYTHNISAIEDFNIEGREEEDDLTLPGSPSHTFNASLSYDAKRFTARASLNYASAFVDEFGEEKFEDVYYDQAIQLDINGTVIITPTVRIYMDALNLLDQPLRYYQGVEDRTYQEEYYNMRLQAGVKVDL